MCICTLDLCGHLVNILKPTRLAWIQQLGVVVPIGWMPQLMLPELLLYTAHKGTLQKAVLEGVEADVVGGRRGSY